MTSSKSEYRHEDDLYKLTGASHRRKAAIYNKEYQAEWLDELNEELKEESERRDADLSFTQKRLKEQVSSKQVRFVSC